MVRRKGKKRRRRGILKEWRRETRENEGKWKGIERKKD